MSITLHYNATCGDCARKAQQTAKLDWLNRVRISIEDSPIGEVPRGEIVVVENATQKVYTGVYATRIIPAYFLYGDWCSSSHRYETSPTKASKDATVMHVKSQNHLARRSWRYSPRNSGRRFSLNAATPSRKSAESKTRNCKLKSSSLNFLVSGSIDN